MRDGMSSLPTGCYGDDRVPLATAGLAAPTRIRDNRPMTKPYEIIRRPITKLDDVWVSVPDDAPVDLRTWSGFAAFVPGDVNMIKKAIAKVQISLPETVIAADGGAWVYAGHNDLAKILTALRGV